MDQLVLTLEILKYSMTLRCFVSEGLAVFFQIRSTIALIIQLHVKLLSPRH